MKVFFVLITLISSFAFAGTEVVCETTADVVLTSNPKMSAGTEINKRVRQLEQLGYKNVEIAQLSTTSAIGGSSNSYVIVTDKVCAVLKY